MSEEFLELLRLLRSHEVEFLLVGAHALALYLEPRTTQDMDLWLSTQDDNLLRFQSAMREFGIQVKEDQVRDFADGRKLIRIGREPNQVDFLSFLGKVGEEMDFADVAGRASRIETNGIAVPVISASDLLRSKEAANRPKDQGDILRLRALLRD